MRMALLPLDGEGAGAVPGAGVGPTPGPGPPQVPPAVFVIITWSAAAAGREWLDKHQCIRQRQQASRSAMHQRIGCSAWNA